MALQPTGVSFVTENLGAALANIGRFNAAQQSIGATATKAGAQVQGSLGDLQSKLKLGALTGEIDQQAQKVQSLGRELLQLKSSSTASAEAIEHKQRVFENAVATMHRMEQEEQRLEQAMRGVGAAAVQAGAQVQSSLGQLDNKIKIDSLTAKIGLQTRSLAILGKELETLSAKEGVSALAVDKKKLAYDRAAAALDKNKQSLAALNAAQQQEATTAAHAGQATQRLGHAAQQSAPQAQALASSIAQASASASAAIPKFNAFEQVVIGGLRRIGAGVVELTARFGRELVDGLGSAVSSAGNFEATVNRFSAVTGSSLAEAGLDVTKFSNLFLKLGADTQYSAMQAAEAGVNLAKGGIDPATIAAGGLSSALSLASAGELDLAQAAQITAKQYGVWTAGMTSAADRAAFLAMNADLLSQAANASTVGVGDLGIGLAQVGGVARVAGLSFQETVTAMALIAPGFHSASDAGTSFKALLNNLQPTTADQTQAMLELGLWTRETGSAFYDQQGRFVGAAEMARLLHTATKDLSQQQKSLALETIFGSDAQRAAALIAEQGAEGYDRMAQSMTGAGTAAEQAAKRQQGWNFLMEQLGGSVETAAIVIGQRLIPVLSPFVELLIDGVNVIGAFAQGSLDASTQLYSFVHAVDAIIPGFENLFYTAQDVLSWLGNLASTAYTYGSGIASNFAQGIADSVSFVVDAMTAIGDTVSYWLEPHSPPKITPDLDRWGADAINVYLGGWGKGDYSIFESIGGVISSQLRSIAEMAGSAIPRTGLIPMIIGTRNAVAEAIEQLRTTGDVAEATYTRITNAAGPAGETIAGVLRLMVAQRRAADDLAAAQDNLDTITGQYDDRLDGLRGTLDDTKDAFADTIDTLKDQAHGIKTAYEVVLDGLGTALDSAKETFSSALDGLRDDLDSTKGYYDNLLGGLTDHLDTINEQFDLQISPIDEQLDAIDAEERRIANAEELAKQQKILNSATATEAQKRKAALKIEKIRLEQEKERLEQERKRATGPIKDQIDQVKKQRDLEVDAIEKRIKAVERERDTIVNGIERQIKEQQRLRDQELAAVQQQIAATEQQRDLQVAALESEIAATEAQRDLEVEAAKARVEAAELVKAAVDEELSARQAGIKMQQDQNDLVREQLGILQQIAKENEAERKAAEAAAKKAAKAGGKKAGGGAKAKKPTMPIVGRPEGASGDATLADLPTADAVNTYITSLDELRAKGQAATAAARAEASRIDGIAKQIGVSSELFKTALAGIGAVVASVVVPAMWSASGAFLAAAAPIALIAGAGALLYQAWANDFLGIQGVVSDVFSGITSILDTTVGAFQTTKEAGGTFWESLAAGAQAGIGAFLEGFPAMVVRVGGFLGDVVNYAFENLPKWTAALVEFGVKAVTWISDAWPGVADQLGRMFKGMVNWVLDSIPGWASNLAEFGGKAIGWVLDALPGLGTNLGKMAGTIIGWIVETTADAIPKLAKLGWQFISWVLTDVLPELPTVLEKIGDGITAFVLGFVDEVKPHLAKVATRFLAWVQEDVMPYLSGKLNAISTGITTWVNGAITGIKNKAAEIGTGMLSAIRGAIEDGWYLFVRWITDRVWSIISNILEGIGIGGSGSSSQMRGMTNPPASPNMLLSNGTGGMSVVNNYSQTVNTSSPQFANMSYQMMQLKG